MDDVDLPGGYDPRDHFDNGYIEESWKQVAIRLEQFRTAGVRNLDLFHRAAHAIGDFYAHSSYGEFAALQNGKLALYDPSNRRHLFRNHRTMGLVRISTSLQENSLPMLPYGRAVLRRPRLCGKAS